MLPSRLIRVVTPVFEKLNTLSVCSHGTPALPIPLLIAIRLLPRLDHHEFYCIECRSIAVFTKCWAHSFGSIPEVGSTGHKVALLLFIFPLGTSVLFHNSGSTLYWRPQCRRLLSSPSSLHLCQLFFLKDIPDLICIFLIIRELSIPDTHGSEHWPLSMSGLEKWLLLLSAQSQSGILATEFSNSIYTFNINLSDIQSANNIFQFIWLAIPLIISFVELFNVISSISPHFVFFSSLSCWGYFKKLIAKIGYKEVFHYVFFQGLCLKS